MKDIFLDCNFLVNKEKYEQKENKPYVIALGGLMLVTGVHRLFEKNDVYELIKRVQLFFPEQNMIDNFFTNDLLFSFKYKHVCYQFKFEHLKELIGLETLNAAKNSLAYSDWIIKNESCVIMYNICLLDGFLSGLILDHTKERFNKNNPKGSYSLMMKQRILSLSKECVLKADFLAEKIASELNLFDRLKSDFPNKLMVLHMRNRPFVEPKFNIKNISESVMIKLNTHFNMISKTDDCNKLIYLSWLWANGFVIECKDGFLYVDSRVKSFDLNDYKLLGESLSELYIQYKLNDILFLLKDIEVQKIAHKSPDKINIYENNSACNENKFGKTN